MREKGVIQGSTNTKRPPGTRMRSASCKNFQPWAGNQIRGNDLRKKLLEETWAASNFDRDSSRGFGREQARKQFLLVNTAQHRLLFPDAAMLAEILLRL